MEQRTAKQVIQYAKDQGALVLDIKFSDFPPSNRRIFSEITEDLKSPSKMTQLKKILDLRVHFKIMLKKTLMHHVAVVVEVTGRADCLAVA